VVREAVARAGVKPEQVDDLTTVDRDQGLC